MFLSLNFSGQHNYAEILYISIEEGRAASKSPHFEKFGYFLSISQQVFSADITKIQLLQYLNHEY